MSLLSVFLLTSLLDKNNLNKALESIKSGIEFTQLLAISYGRSAFFCSSKDNLNCSQDWNNGQLTIFIGQKIFYQFSPLPSNYRLVWKSSLGKNNRLMFTKEGTAQQQGSFYLCNKKSNYCSLRIVVLQTGRIRIQQIPLTQWPQAI